ncbi:GyrI-like domain-containing protein [Lentilactobacillus kosonis]|uniref:Uncharacterized protein n=1 Tax=Lentilactobacillus kosonis TaxID=2810561 RepID=A0A401FPV0_9LACO|nr:GyrI-like domain-containing protein [Lentilactobacillus kosonis]GAY74410.1 hypothetical protein NBRC111893_2556 [Lentilactobacillus kosonis]
MDKFDYRVMESAEYSKETVPSIVHLNERNYLTFEGTGKFDLTDSNFKETVSAMYDLAAGIKQAASTSKQLDWFRNYEPYPLNSYWHTDGSYMLMVKQPNFTIPELLPVAKELVKNKYPQEVLDQIKFTRQEEGYEVQSANKGPLNKDSSVWDTLRNFVDQHQLTVTDDGHREVYLTNLLTVNPADWEILVRQPISHDVTSSGLEIITN